MSPYSDKPPTYFAHARQEIRPLLPMHCGRVLEVGCGTGATLAWLRSQNCISEAVGIEISQTAADIAKPRLDAVYCFDFETTDLPEQQPFDVILCLDVLEHMLDPWAVVHRLVDRYLVEGGTLVVSLPNVRHHSVVLPLLLHGAWDYSDAGLLDRTHLRFFTHATAEKLVKHTCLHPVRWLRFAGSLRTKKGWLNMLTGGIFENFWTYQLVFSVQKKS